MAYLVAIAEAGRFCSSVPDQIKKRIRPFNFRAPSRNQPFFLVVFFGPEAGVEATTGSGWRG